MDIGVEISLYPLQDEFAEVIHQFIGRLNADGRFRVVSNSMSTQVFGPCDEVLDAVRREVRTTFEGLEADSGKAVFVMKVFGPLGLGLSARRRSGAFTIRAWASPAGASGGQPAK